LHRIFSTYHCGVLRWTSPDKRTWGRSKSNGHGTQAQQLRPCALVIHNGRSLLCSVRPCALMPARSRSYLRVSVVSTDAQRRTCGAGRQARPQRRPCARRSRAFQKLPSRATAPAGPRCPLCTVPATCIAQLFCLFPSAALLPVFFFAKQVQM
jgi:hypothetical protein